MKLRLVGAVLALAASSAYGQTSALTDTLQQLEEQSWRAWKAQDAAFFQRFLSDDHVELGFFGPGTKADVVKGVAAKACEVKSYSVDHFKATRIDANTALLTYHAAQDTHCGTAPVPSPVWASSLYVRRSGRWLNVAYQQTQDLRPAPR
jgi:hypothetical protein